MKSKQTTWFITGVGRGLGRCLAEEVLRRGGNVAGTVRDLAHGEELQREFPSRVWLSVLDLSDLANCAATFQAAVEHFGQVDVLVNNAAYSVLGAAEELEPATVRGIVDTNLLASMELARVAIGHMRERGGGRLIQISSSAGQAAFPGLSAYCATKWAVEGFFESLAGEVAGFGIGTTIVEPGTIRTGFGGAGVLSPAIAAYEQGPVGYMRKMAIEGYEAPGDPAKMARAIVDTYDAVVPPLRLALGPDAYQYIRAALERRLEELEANRAVTVSTNYEIA